jgi:tryptophan synthase alpha chain
VTTRYAQQANHYRQAGRKGFIPFTLLGWPSFESSYRQLACMIEANPYALEIGLPFSDPVADGPIIQQAVFQALQAGFTLQQAWPWLARVRQLSTTIPMGLLVYHNMVQAVGLERFCQQAKASGVDGLLIADLPPEMAEAYVVAAHAAELDRIFIASSLTTADRLAHIASLGSGFIYGVSRLGITGVENRYDPALPTMMAQCRTVCPQLPLFMGFGISTPQDAQHMAQMGADGVITGSRIVQMMQQKPAAQTEQDCLLPYLHSMVQAVNTVPSL